MSTGRTASVRRLSVLALTGGALAAGALLPSPALASRPAARGTPSQVIDARKDPDKAGKALNNQCNLQSHNCTWDAPAKPTVGYGPQQILGDALYNCSEEEYAETAVGVSDERAETTSISESLSLKISLGFLGFEKTSAEFEAFSKQAQTFSTTVTATNSVAVPPMWKGWTQTQLLSAKVTGNAFITDGINNLVEVKNIDLTFPGYQDPNNPQAKVIYTGVRTPMTKDDIASHCDAINGLGRTLTTPTPASFKITICRPRPAPGPGSTQAASARSACVKRRVVGMRPPVIAEGTATLTAGGRTYAVGTDTNGRIRLTLRRPLPLGQYTLSLTQDQGAATKRADRNLATVLPITLT